MHWSAVNDRTNSANSLHVVSPSLVNSLAKLVGTASFGHRVQAGVVPGQPQVYENARICSKSAASAAQSSPGKYETNSNNSSHENNSDTTLSKLAGEPPLGQKVHALTGGAAPQPQYPAYD
mmetsp:Transcript_26585/g.63368  ORF Transcript_26585/g.63368 Transcript_26585/m.63368 type:complete len:121 (-) Transcript_26585:1907-2269(-)